MSSASGTSWRKANPERYKAITAAWREANRERINANAAAVYAANPEKDKAKEISLRLANPEKYRKQRSAVAAKRLTKLPDSYVANALMMPVSQCTPELIEMKREQLLMHRALRELNKILKEKNGS